MKFEIQPTDNRLVVKPLTADEVSKGGVIIPDTAQEKPQQALVAAAGPGARHPQTGVIIPMSIREGDRVLYGKYSGTEVTVDGESYLILREPDILAVLKPLGWTPNEEMPQRDGFTADVQL